MKIVSEIFDEFFKRLREDNTYSKDSIDQLRELLVNDQRVSPDQILAIISDMNDDNA